MSSSGSVAVTGAPMSSPADVFSSTSRVAAGLSSKAGGSFGATGTGSTLLAETARALLPDPSPSV